MDRARIALKVLSTLLRTPKSILRVLGEHGEVEATKKAMVQKEYGLSNGLPTIDILDLFPDFNVQVDPYSFLQGTSLVSDIALLNALAEKKKGCTYLEIGTWRGESVANVARYAGRCVTISLSKEELLASGRSEEFACLHGFFSSSLHNVEHIGHNSHTFDFALLGTAFDLIFVDGDHSYGGVKSDTAKVFDLLRDDDSVIVWHDYARTPETIRWDLLAGILDGCPPDKRGHLYHVSNTLCAIYIHWDAATSFTQFPSRPNKRFALTVSGEPCGVADPMV